MKMVLVAYRHYLDQDVRNFLKSIDMVSFTESPSISGICDAGHAFGTWPGHHAMILSGMEDLQAKQLIARLKDFRDEWVQQNSGAKIPMRAFSLPCERLI